MSEVKFSKKQIIKKYIGREDLLNTLLKDKKQYTLSEVDSMIEKFMKGKVE